ncbi:ATP-binding protein [Micromonospora humida]|uniref:ATP-binding protein n=1 Tax=Micromonospora humida TaxID=2809018 RepID=UPI00340BBA48
MDEAHQRALTALRFDWAPTPDDVWQPLTDVHVPALHDSILRQVLDGVAEARKSGDSSPIGFAILGIRGTGKTHLLGAVREQVHAEGGYFFLVSLLEASAFWRSTALSILDGFFRELPSGETQLRTFLRRLAEQVSAPRAVRRAVIGDTELTRPNLDAFVDLTRKLNRQVGMECQDTIRALVLQAAEDPRLQDIGYEFLCSNDEEEAGQRAAWGMRRGKRSAQEVVRDVSRLLALTGPTVVAVDQIDILVNQSEKMQAHDEQARWQATLLLEQIAGGLMALREHTRRSLSVVSCLPQVWAKIKNEATDTVQDRFREAIQLNGLPNAEVARDLVARRFARCFAEVDFTPPYDTWPVLPAAFDEAVDFTPRELLRTVDAHIRTCLSVGEVHEMAHLTQPARAARVLVRTVDETSGPAAGQGNPGLIDSRFAELLAQVDPSSALRPETEDAVVPELLTAGLTAWIAAQGTTTRPFSIDPRAGGKPALHARMRRNVDEETERQEHWSFRAVRAPHHIAALNRIRNAVTTAGLTAGVAERRLFLLRTPAWSPGTRTQEVIKAFQDAGGRTLPFDEPDVVRLMALRDLIGEFGLESLREWFITRCPADEVVIFRQAFADVTLPSDTTSSEAAAHVEPVGPPAVVGPSEAAGRSETTMPPEALRSEGDGVPAPAVAPTPDAALPIGRMVRDGSPVGIDLEALRRHVAIFAGSGSGKTVLIRRLVEECALRGVSSIVLDPNNDLARLGDRWPTPPGAWEDTDTDRAAAYLAQTEVTVWTPRLTGGRPLTFQPLPNFADILDDPDAFAAGVDAAVVSLAPHARVDGGTDKARLGRAVLREALMSYARTGGSELRAFIGLLNALPDGVSLLDDAPRLGANMAQLLTAAMVNDPLFGGNGAPVDPGVLLTPPPGRRARVSVISFVGLPDDQQRQSFVNQLQLSLFAWIKRNPAGDRPLGGLFVMDEAQTLAPSGALTACTQSTLALASQARKYGLGLVFATQAPKGLHNQIPGNAATQFFGLLNSPAQIDAAKELARAKGSEISDVARLRTGQFYATLEGSEFTKVQAPLCLTHHPRSPLTVEEVLDRARRP